MYLHIYNCQSGQDLLLAQLACIRDVVAPAGWVRWVVGSWQAWCLSWVAMHSL